MTNSGTTASESPTTVIPRSAAFPPGARPGHPRGCRTARPGRMRRRRASASSRARAGSTSQTGLLGRDERVAEIAARDAARPVEVLDHRRRDRCRARGCTRRPPRRCRIASEHGPSEVSRQELRRGEHDHAQQDERDHGEARGASRRSGPSRAALWAGGRSQSPAARSFPLGERRLRDTDVRDRIGRVVPHLAGRGAREREEVRSDHRRVPQEEARHLLRRACAVPRGRRTRGTPAPPRRTRCSSTSTRSRSHSSCTRP